MIFLSLFKIYKSVSCNYTKSFKNKTTLNIVNVSYSFTQFSTLDKTYTTTAREPSIYTQLHNSTFFANLDFYQGNKNKEADFYQCSKNKEADFYQCSKNKEADFYQVNKNKEADFYQGNKNKEADFYQCNKNKEALQQVDDVIENEKFPDRISIPNPGQKKADELRKPLKLNEHVQFYKVIMLS